jgi:hypothetical protein
MVFNTVASGAPSYRLVDMILQFGGSGKDHVTQLTNGLAFD